MSTSLRNTSARRIARLAASGQQIFHIHDLAQLLQIPNENSLRVTLHRLMQAGILYHIQRGLYSLVPIENLDPLSLGIACLHRFAYLTTESVLRDEGYILQSTEAFTFVSSVSRTFVAGRHRYISRRLHPRFLHNQAGMQQNRGIRRATADRAIADMLYFDPWYHFDRPVRWKRIATLQNDIGYPPTPHRYADPTRS